MYKSGGRCCAWSATVHSMGSYMSVKKNKHKHDRLHVKLLTSSGRSLSLSLTWNAVEALESPTPPHLSLYRHCVWSEVFVVRNPLFYFLVCLDTLNSQCIQPAPVQLNRQVRCSSSVQISEAMTILPNCCPIWWNFSLVKKKLYGHKSKKLNCMQKVLSSLYIAHDFVLLLFLIVYVLNLPSVVMNTCVHLMHLFLLWWIALSFL